MNSSFKIFMFCETNRGEESPIKIFKMSLESSLAISDVY